MAEVLSHIQLPQPRKNWVRRQRALDSLFSALDSRLILVVAGAGYGKTGLLAQFAKIEGFTFSWLTLDEREQDLRVFGEALVSSLKQCFPDFGQQTMQLLTSSSIEQNIGLLVRTIVRELVTYLTQPICMVLDDFHIVEASAPVIQFVDRLISSLPDEAHLIIASRNLPPLQLGVLIAQQQVAALGQSVLRLDTDETRQLLAGLNDVKLQDVDAAAAERTHAITEGWLVGVLMTNHIERMREAQIGLGTPRAVDLLSEFLMVRVVQELPKPLQEFLYRSSILDEVSIPFCANEIGWCDTHDQILEVERRNLFIQPIGADGAGDTTYRYHPLFREFLVQRLREDDPLRYAQLNHDAGAAYERAGNVELAARHMLAGGWGDDMMRIAEAHAPALLQRGQYRTVLDWLARIDAISPGARRERHILWQHEIWAHLNLSQDAQSMAALEKLDELYQRTGDLGRRDTLNIRRGLLLYRASNYQKALQSVNNVVTSIYPQPLFAQVEAQRIAAMCLYELGNLREAQERIQSAEELTQTMGRPGYEAVARVKLTRAGILDALGETAAALRAGSEALTLAEEIKDDALIAESLVEVAELLVYSGAQDNLLDMVKHGLALADATGNQTIRIFGLSVLAQALAAQEQLDEAAQSGAAALALARQITQAIERSAVLFHSLNVQSQVLCRCAMQQQNAEQRTSILQQALGLAREAATIAESSQSARLHLQAYARLGAVQALQGDLDLARATLANVQLMRGEYCNNATGLVYLWQAILEWELPHPDARQLRSHLERVQQISSTRRQTYFIRGEGPAIWQVYQTLCSAPDLEAFIASRDTAKPLRQTAEHASAAVPSQPRISLVQHDLRVAGFGQGRVWRGDELITNAQWGWSIPREMFFYILTMRQATRAKIGLLFWPDSTTSSMQNGFHNAKFAIRSAVGKPAMVYVNGAYSVNPDLDYLYDVETFEHQITTAAQLPPEQALDLWLDTLQLYQDDFLVDYSSEWVEDMRNKLQVKYQECCLKAGEAALGAGRFKPAIDTLELAVQRDTINEDIARLLMTLQWRSGKRRAALDTYFRLKTALNSQMGLAPEALTEQLFATLKGN